MKADLRSLGAPRRAHSVHAFVKFLRWAPLGDPLEIELRGYRLSLRKHDAEQIEVRPV